MVEEAGAALGGGSLRPACAEACVTGDRLFLSKQEPASEPWEALLEVRLSSRAGLPLVPTQPSLRMPTQVEALGRAVAAAATGPTSALPS